MKDYRPQINIVIPLFNERETFPYLIDSLKLVMSRSAKTISVILVDDGSSDGTDQLMKELAMNDPAFEAVFLSRNFGHQRALTAGMSCVDASEAIMVIDGDLQDPPEMLDVFLEKLEEGYEVIYAIRKNREAKLLLRLAYKFFYRVMKKVSYTSIPLDSGDFSLMSRRVVDQINRMPEESRFIRGMRSWVGFRQIGIPYNRGKRFKGESKYSWSELFNLAIDGLFNFSKYPIRMALVPGFVALTISTLYFMITLARKLFVGDVPLGFTGLLFTITLFGGLQLIAIGVIGEYILRIFFQVKNRPLFIIKERIKAGSVLPPD